MKRQALVLLTALSLAASLNAQVWRIDYSLSDHKPSDAHTIMIKKKTTHQFEHQNFIPTNYYCDGRWHCSRHWQTTYSYSTEVDHYAVDTAEALDIASINNSLDILQETLNRGGVLMPHHLTNALASLEFQLSLQATSRTFLKCAGAGLAGLTGLACSSHKGILPATIGAASAAMLGWIGVRYMTN